MSEPGRITTVISDFGGVLTTPLVQSFAAVQDETGIPFEELAKAMARIQEEDGRQSCGSCFSRLDSHPSAPSTLHFMGALELLV